jgi:hypothetical protein
MGDKNPKQKAKQGVQKQSDKNAKDTKRAASAPVSGANSTAKGAKKG